MKVRTAGCVAVDRIGAGLVGAVCSGLFWVGLLSAGPQTDTVDDGNPRHSLGWRLYHEGDSGRGVIAVLGDGGTEVPAAVLPCAGCHGADGLGRSEGGLDPANITWDTLRRPATSGLESGRSRPAYDDRTLVRAITMGRDSAGEALHAAMPRYRLTSEEASALVAYLRGLGSEEVPGVSAGAVRLGVVLPPGEGAHERRAAIRGILAAAADRVERRGGVYGRRMDLRFLETPEAPAERMRGVAEFLETEKPFALIAPFAVGIEEAMAELMAATGTPTIGPFAIDPPVADPPVAEVFYLLPGLAQQARALLRFAVDLEGPTISHVVVVSSAGSQRVEALVQALEREPGRGNEEAAPMFSRLAIGAELASGDLGEIAERLRRLEPDAVLVLLPWADARSLLLAAEPEAGDWVFLFLGPLTGVWTPETALDPAVFESYVAWPTLPQDTLPEAWVSYQQLVEGAAWANAHRAAQLSALAAFELTMEALRKIGSRLDRERLIHTLEGMYRQDTGYTQPVTFDPNRRIGALGAWVVGGNGGQEAQWVPLSGIGGRR